METSITRRRRKELIIGAGLLMLLALLPLPIHDVYTRNLIIITVLFAGLAQAWNVLGGYCGQISLSHALYFGVGAYVSTLLLTRAGLPPTIGMFAGGALAGLVALLVGWPCFRLSGHYYAIATVVVGEIGYLLALNWDWIGGATGINIPYRRAVGNSWLWLQFRIDKLPYHYAALAFAAVAWLVAWWIEGSRWGFVWRAVKDDPVAARSLAVRIFPSKMAAAAISGALTGIGGAIYAQYVGYIDPDSVLYGQLSILIPLPAVLGGVGTLWGPLVGAAVLIPLSELTRSYLGGSGRGVDLMIYGGLIVLVALARPQGLASLIGVRVRAPGDLNPERTMPPLLEVDGVSKSFGGVAANVDISFDVREGEILGLIGPNGAGKTSLFNAISGAVVPDAGEIRLAGRRVSGLPPEQCALLGIARTFQVVRSFDSMTVLENVMVGAYARHSRTRMAMRRALETATFTGLAARADVPAHALTPAEKRRLEVARALATEPRLLLLDEMLTGLTPVEAAAGVQLIRDVRARGITVMMVEHVMEVLLPLIDRAVVLDLGRVLTTGSPAEVVRNPEVIRAYLGERYAAA